MSNSLRLAKYRSPFSIEQSTNEWLIVERFGSNGEFITISDAGAIVGSPDAAPDGITPSNSMHGVLLRETDDEAVFLLARHLTDEASVEGRFFPADGYARLSRINGQLTLEASGRHAHQESGGQLQDVPDPQVGDGMAWHFDAKQVQWSGQEGSP